jgi:hypothetical protein
MRSCIYVQVKYKEIFRQLRDSLGGNQALSSFPSVSSVLMSSEHQSTSSQKDQPMNKKSQTSNRKNESSKNHGILMSEEDIIFGHIDTFCNRIQSVIDQYVSLAQFHALYKTSPGLSRPKREDLRSDEYQDSFIEDSDNDEYNPVKSDPNMGEANGEFTDLFSSNKAILDILIEENEDEAHMHSQSFTKLKNDMGKAEANIDNLTNNNENQNNSDSDFEDFINEEKEVVKRPLSSNKKLLKATERLFTIEKNIEKDSESILKKAQTLSKDDLKLMRKYYNKSDEGPNVSFIIEGYINQMKKMVSKIKAQQLLDVETKDSNM